MKKKILAIFALVALFGLGIAAYAYSRANITAAAAACSCCKDSCPMKTKDGNTTAGAHKCCGDSCPMKGEHGKSGDHAKMEGHSCCGDSCPMKKKDGQTAATAGATSDEGKGCCDNCECCKGKEKPKTDAAAL